MNGAHPPMIMTWYNHRRLIGEGPLVVVPVYVTHQHDKNGYSVDVDVDITKSVSYIVSLSFALDLSRSLFLPFSGLSPPRPRQLSNFSKLALMATNHGYWQRAPMRNIFNRLGYSTSISIEAGTLMLEISALPWQVELVQAADAADSEQRRLRLINWAMIW